MADIELVIKIPEDVYKRTKFYKDIHGLDDYITTIKALENGTPLPKGHGKIIDVNDLLDRICLDDTDENREDNVGEIITLEDIDFIPAIIEADKSESEG